MQKNNQKIPEGWSVRKLGDLGIFSKGSGITKNDLVSDGLPCIRYAELYTKYNFVIPNCVSFISEEVSKTAKPIQCGDILFAGSGETKEEIGKCAVYDNPITAYAGGDNIILHPSGVNSVFLSYFLNTAGRRYLNRLGQGDSIVHIHAEHLKKIYVPIPPLPEQEKITEILGTWDEAIEKLSNLIEQKKLLKKGLMQKLLTGKTRLSGFTLPWKKIEFDTIFYIEKGIKNKQIQTKEYQRNGCFPVVDQGKELIVAYCDMKEKLYDDTPVIVFGDHTRILKFITFPFVIGADGTQLIKANNKYSLTFCFYVLQNTHIANRGYSRHMSLLKEKVFTIPSDIAEQQAIADVLSTADDEIYLLNQKLEALKKQKKGLMQQLLTGQIRVKVN